MRRSVLIAQWDRPGVGIGGAATHDVDNQSRQGSRSALRRTSRRCRSAPARACRAAAEVPSEALKVVGLVRIAIAERTDVKRISTQAVSLDGSATVSRCVATSVAPSRGIGRWPRLNLGGAPVRRSPSYRSGSTSAITTMPWRGSPRALCWGSRLSFCVGDPRGV